MTESNLEKLFNEYKTAYPAIDEFLQKMYEQQADPLKMAIFLNVLCGEQISRYLQDIGFTEDEIDFIAREEVEQYSNVQSKTKILPKLIGFNKILGINLLTVEQIQNSLEKGGLIHEERSNESTPSDSGTEGNG